MNTLAKTKEIMRKNSIFAKKSFGQNFLIDDGVLQNIVDSANVQEGDIVIEIGPGLGNLTHYILEKKAKVYAFEIDNDMIDILQERFGNDSKLVIKNEDILKANLDEIFEKGKVKIIANLPYYITTPIIFKLLEYRKSIQSITIMIQKEVAERITATPNGKEYGVLTINTNVICDTQILFNVPNTSFIPAPKVISTVINIIPNEEKEKSFNIKSEEIFKELVKKAFSARRKKVANSLSNTGLYDLTKTEIEKIITDVTGNVNSRAEEISIKQYAKITNIIYEKISRD